MSNTTLVSSSDSFSHTGSPQATAAKATPRFGSWWKLGLGLTELGLKWGSDRLDRSMQRDEERRKSRQRFYQDSSHTQYNGNYYRTVTVTKVYDGNHRRVRREDTRRVGPWHRIRSSRRSHRSYY